MVLEDSSIIARFALCALEPSKITTPVFHQIKRAKSVHTDRQKRAIQSKYLISFGNKGLSKYLYTNLLLNLLLLLIMLTTKFISFITVLVLLLSCTEEDRNKLPQNWHIQGKVEKGPFVKGSNVTIQELDESLNPTGRSFKTSIIDNEGSFNLDNITLQTPYILLIADGYFFNEVNGSLSEGQISLHSLADLSVSSSVNINILTHLKKDRLAHLIKEEHLSYKEANTLAQKELLTCFGLHRYADKEVNSYSIATGTDESGVLIVVSSTLLKDMSEAKFTERLAELSGDLKNDGKLSDTNRNMIRKNSEELNIDNISKHIVEHYKLGGKDVVVPNLAYFIDWDKNGIAGDELGPETNKELSFETDSLFIGKEGGRFKVKIKGNIPCQFPTDQPPIIGPSYYDMGIRDIKYKEIITDDRYLELSIEPAEAILMKAAAVVIYSYDYKHTATLHIIQESNPNGELISKDVKTFYTQVLEKMRDAFSMSALMETHYSQSLTPEEGSKWESFYKHKLGSYNNEIYDTWKYSYNALQYIRTAKERYKDENVDLGVAAFNNLEAMIYYQLGVLWGNIAYVKTSQSYDLQQLNEKQILALFEKPLLKSIDLMLNKKNNNLIFVSKDTPRAILAKMYMQSGEYAKALPLLKAIISNGDYNISPSWKSLFAENNQELIFSLLQNTESNDYSNLIVKSHYLPLLTYTEVVLYAAECELRTGNKNKALSYLNTVRSKRGKSNVDSSDLEIALASTWKEELKGCFSYFAFLNRNNLSEKELNIESYQKLFPIPEREIMISSLKQNPGY